MKIVFLSCCALGSLVVIQPLLNRMIYLERGLSLAALINATVLWLFSSCLFLFTWLAPTATPEIFRLKSYHLWHWWYVLPGLIGLVLVSMVPIAIDKLGTFITVLAMLVGQLLTSFIWDIITHHEPIVSTRALGLILAISGAYLSVKSHN